MAGDRLGHLQLAGGPGPGLRGCGSQLPAAVARPGHRPRHRGLGVDHRERRPQDRPDRAARPVPRRAGLDGALAGRSTAPDPRCWRSTSWPTSCAGPSRDRPSVPGLDARHGLGHRIRRCRAGSTPPAGDGSHPRAAAPGCGSCSASPAWPCSPAATTARGGRWTTGIRAATRGSRCRRASRRPTTAAHPGQIAQPWLREAVKWHLGTMLEAGALRWTTVSQERLPCLLPLRPLAGAPSTTPATSWATRRAAAEQAAAFRRWDADPANRPRAPTRTGARPWCHPRLINDDLRAVAELFAFVAANPVEARRMLGPSPWPAGHRRARGRLVPPGLPHPAPARPQRPGTTSTTTPSRRSPPRCPCSGCHASSRCRSPAATAPRCSRTASTTRRRCA